MSSEAQVRLLRMSEVLSITGLKSRSTIYELTGRGLFPQPIRLTAKAIAFIESEVNAWVRSRIEARPASPPPVKPARVRHQRPPATTQPPATQPPPATPRRRGPARTRAQRQLGSGE